MKYVLRHLINALSMPLVLMLGLLLIAAFLRWRGYRRASWATALSGILLLYLSAIAPVSNALIAPLESWPALSDAHLPRDIAGIAVLGALYRPRDDTPITGQIPGSGLARVAEGVRLARHYGNVRLVLSGGVPPDSGRAASSHGYAIFAREMGIDPASIVVIDQPATTSEEAHALAKLFGDAPFLLVTSASHMNRAMRLFEGTGAHPIPAPTGQQARAPKHLDDYFVPRSESLNITETALHEYLGILAISAGQG
jgi:uncharacterized SAM-binding protein YcdF (DUF218 family)